MICLKYILVLPFILLLLSHKPSDGPTKTCKLSSSYNKKDSSSTFRTKGLDWAELEKRVVRKDSFITLTLYIINGEVDNSEGIRFIFRDGTSLTKPDAPAKHEMGLSAGGGSSIIHTAIFTLNQNDLTQLKDNLILEYRIGKAAKKILTEKQALKFKEGLDCIISAK
jgi:hypothetical protein